MIRELTPYVKVNLFVDTDSTKNDVLRRLKKNGIDEIKWRWLPVRKTNISGEGGNRKLNRKGEIIAVGLETMRAIWMRLPTTL